MGGEHGEGVMKVFTELSQVETAMLAINQKLFLFGLISTEPRWLNLPLFDGEA